MLMMMLGLVSDDVDDGVNANCNHGVREAVIAENSPELIEHSPGDSPTNSPKLADNSPKLAETRRQTHRNLRERVVIRTQADHKPDRNQSQNRPQTECKP